MSFSFGFALVENLASFYLFMLFINKISFAMGFLSWQGEDMHVHVRVD